jgi:hypothetical protein
MLIPVSYVEQRLRAGSEIYLEMRHTKVRPMIVQLSSESPTRGCLVHDCTCAR